MQACKSIKSCKLSWMPQQFAMCTRRQIDFLILVYLFIRGRKPNCSRGAFEDFSYLHVFFKIYWRLTFAILPFGFVYSKNIPNTLDGWENNIYLFLGKGSKGILQVDPATGTALSVADWPLSRSLSCTLDRGSVKSTHAHTHDARWGGSACEGERRCGGCYAPFSSFLSIFWPSAF